MERWQGHWQLAEIGDGMQWHGKDNTDDRQHHDANQRRRDGVGQPRQEIDYGQARSEEHTSELQSLMRSSYAVFCLQKKNIIKPKNSDAYEQSSKHKRHA